MNPGDSSAQWAAAFGAFDNTKTSHGDANSAWNCASKKHLVSECGSAAACRIGSWRQSPDVPLPDVPVLNDTLLNEPFREAHADGQAGVEWTGLRVAEEAMIVALALGLGFCLVLFLCSDLSFFGFDFYTHRMCFGLFRVYFMSGIGIGFILLILL